MLRVSSLTEPCPPLIICGLDLCVSEDFPQADPHMGQLLSSRNHNHLIIRLTRIFLTPWIASLAMDFLVRGFVYLPHTLCGTPAAVFTILWESLSGWGSPICPEFRSFPFLCYLCHYLLPQNVVVMDAMVLKALGQKEFLCFWDRAKNYSIAQHQFYSCVTLFEHCPGNVAYHICKDTKWKRVTEWERYEKG